LQTEDLSSIAGQLEMSVEGYFEAQVVVLQVPFLHLLTSVPDSW
jgi:hypothetical protein